MSFLYFYSCVARKFLRSPRGKHCKLQSCQQEYIAEGCFDAQINNLRERSSLFRCCFISFISQKMIFIKSSVVTQYVSLGNVLFKEFIKLHCQLGRVKFKFIKKRQVKVISSNNLSNLNELGLTMQSLKMHNYLHLFPKPFLTIVMMMILSNLSTLKNAVV